MSVHIPAPRKRDATDESSFLDQHSRPPQTKIACSLRPSTDLQTIKHMLTSGMNVARIACAYGTQNELESLINRVRDASYNTKRLCGIVLETHGTSAMVGPVSKSQPESQSDSDQESIAPLSLNNTPSKKAYSNELQVLATALDLDIDNLPSHIVNNARFAVNNIINTEQKERINDIEQTAEDEKQEKKQQPEAQAQAQPAAESSHTNVQAGLHGSPLLFPLAMSPRTQQSQKTTILEGGSNGNNMQINTSPVHQGRGGTQRISQTALSYDGDSFVFQPDITLIKGSTVRIMTDRVIQGDSTRFSICFPGLTNKLSVGKSIIIHPSIKLEIKHIDNKLNILTCLVLKGGPLKEYSAVEFPSLKLRKHKSGSILASSSQLTQQDVSDIGFAVKNGADYICVSHVKSVSDITATREMLEFQTASIHHMKRNRSYDLSVEQQTPTAYLHKTSSDQKVTNLGDGEHLNNNIKVLAKIQNYQCLQEIDEIISESDGIIIDHVSLLHSYRKHMKNRKQEQPDAEQVDPDDPHLIELTPENIEEDDNDDDDDDEADDGIGKYKEKVTEFIQSMVLEARKQAKPFSICCEIQTQLAHDKSFTVSDIEHDLKLLNDVPGIPINLNSFLTHEDIVCIEYCIAYGCDAICLCSDINRLKEQFNTLQESRSAVRRSNVQLGYEDNDDVLYLHGLLRAICDVIKSKERSAVQFYQRTGLSLHTYSNTPAAHHSMNHLHPMDVPSANSSSHYNVRYNELSPKPPMPATKNGHAQNNNNLGNDLSDSADEMNSAYSDSSEARKIYEVESVINSMASSAVKSAYDMDCSLIIVLTQSGRIARIVSKYRPHCTILAITDSEIIAKQCMFVSSVFPILVLNMNGTDSLISRALYIAYKYKLIHKKNDKVVVLAGTQSDILDEPCDFIMKLLYVDL